MTRPELVKLRQDLQRAVDERKRLGDYNADAPYIRLALESQLAMVDHTLSRMKKD